MNFQVKSITLNINKKITIHRSLWDFFDKHYAANTFSDLNFETVSAHIRPLFPKSKFNPAHLAWYKSKYLTDKAV